jgi:hypothetical protein
MREQAFRFGRARHLVGVAGLPPAAPGTTGVIVLNAGMVHRVGPFRLHVDMTRRLNELGYPTLRFDLSTIGDSGSSGESQTRKQQVCADVDDAMALLHQHGGCSRFVLVGLCSGAQNAHTVACGKNSHEKLDGVVFLDGYAYRTIGFRLRHYLPRMFDAKRWWRWLARKSREVAGVRDDPVFGVSPLPQDVVRADLAGMLDRGLKLSLIYSGGINMDFNHSRQFRECFGAIMNRAAVSTRYIEEADHTYVLADDRQHLIVHIEEWLQQNFPIAHAGVPS